MKDCIRISAAAIILFLVFNEGYSQNALPQLIRTGHYETYIDEVISSVRGDLNSLTSEQKNYLARAHYERAKVNEKIFEMSIHSTQRLLKIIENEMQADEIQADIAFVRIMEELLFQQVRFQTNMQSSLNHPIGEALMKWLDPQYGLQICQSSARADRGCDLLEILVSGDLTQYFEVNKQLTYLNSDNRESHLARINEFNKPKKEAMLIIEWLHLLQLNVISDFMLAGWLYEHLNDPWSKQAFYRARNWTKFSELNSDFANRFHIYSYLGHNINRFRHCRLTELDAPFIESVSSNIGWAIWTSEALRYCSDIVENRIKATFRDIEPTNRAQAQLIAEAFIGIGEFSRAYDVLTGQISRTDLNSFSAITPGTFATLAYLQFMVGGEENWRNTRNLVSKLEQEFSALTTAMLLLQMATEPPSRQSPNIYIE